MLPAGQTEELGSRGTYTVSGVTYDSATGRAINAPMSVISTVTADEGSKPTREKKPPKQDPPIKPEKVKKVTGFSQDTKFGDLRYPKANIHEDTDYLQIKVLKYEPLGIPKQEQVLKGLRSSKNVSYKTKTALGKIILPIPQNISDTNSTGWGQDNLNVGAAYAMGATQGVITDPNFFEGIMNAIKQAGADISNLVQDGSSQNAANAFFSSEAANLFGANTTFEGVLSRSSGQVLNPNTELLFNSVKLRSFNFSFNLAPRDEGERDEIVNIIRQLKINMAPTTGGTESVKGLFLKTPNVFQLEYMKGAQPHPYLNKFIIAALTNMQVNYTGSGTYMTYHDGMPVHITLTLSFQELSPIYAEDQAAEETGGMGF